MKLKKRRLIALLFALGAVVVWLIVNPASYESEFTQAVNDGADYAAEAVSAPDENAPLARDILEKLEVKGRAPKTDYSREQFYSGWPNVDGCSLRQRIIRREFGESAVLNECNVMAGEYDEHLPCRTT